MLDPDYSKGRLYIMRKAETSKESLPNAITGVSLLTVLIIKDNGRYMAKYPELDIVTEMDTREDAFKTMVELIRENMQKTTNHGRRYTLKVLIEYTISHT